MSEGLGRRDDPEEGNEESLEDLREEFLEKYDGDDGPAELSGDERAEDSASQSDEPDLPAHEVKEEGDAQDHHDADEGGSHGAEENAEPDASKPGEAEQQAEGAEDPPASLEEYREEILEKYDHAETEGGEASSNGDSSDEMTRGEEGPEAPEQEGRAEPEQPLEAGEESVQPENEVEANQAPNLDSEVHVAAESADDSAQQTSDEEGAASSDPAPELQANSQPTVEEAEEPSRSSDQSSLAEETQGRVREGEEEHAEETFLQAEPNAEVPDSGQIATAEQSEAPFAPTEPDSESTSFEVGDGRESVQEPWSDEAAVDLDSSQPAPDEPAPPSEIDDRQLPQDVTEPVRAPEAPESQGLQGEGNQPSIAREDTVPRIKSEESSPLEDRTTRIDATPEAEDQGQQREVATAELSAKPDLGLSDQRSFVDRPEEAKLTSEAWVMSPGVDSAAVALGLGPDSEARNPETPDFRLRSLDADPAVGPLESLTSPETGEADVVQTQLEAASETNVVEKEPEPRTFEAVDYGRGVVVRFPKTDLREKGYDGDEASENRIVELLVRKGDESPENVFGKYSESDRRAVAHVNGIGGKEGDRYSLVDARDVDVERFVHLFDRNKCEHVENVGLESEEGKVFVNVDARRVELEDWRLSTSRNQVVLSGRLGGEADFKIGFDGRNETMRLGKGDVVEGMKVDDDELVVRYSQSKSEKHDYRMYLEHAEEPERPSLGQFGKTDILEHVKSFDHPSLVEGEYRFTADDALTSEVERILAKEETYGGKHVDRMKAEISERLVPTLLEATGWEKVKRHPFNETRKESTSANGVDWLVRTPDGKLALMEVKWWGDETKAESKGALQVMEALESHESQLNFDGERIVGAYVAVMKWDANDEPIRIFVKRIRSKGELA